MRLKQKHKLAVAVAQIAIIAVAFLLINGAVALFLYLVSEVSFSELTDFIFGLWSGEALALGWHLFRRAKHKVEAMLNEERDSEVVSARIEELKRLLRK